MDPTIQRRQRPLKAALDTLVFTLTTYLLPACYTLAVLFMLYGLGFHGPPAAMFGCVYYFILIYEAATLYRREIALPRAIDQSLDPPTSRYLTFFLGRLGFFSLLPLLLLTVPTGAGHRLLALGGILGMWAYVLIRETAVGQFSGQPYLAAGSMGIRIKPVRFVRELIRRAYGRLTLSVPWGGVDLPFGELLKNFFLIGAVGTGKTLVIKSYLTRLLPNVYRYPSWRSVVIDPKGDLAPTVLALIPRHKVQTINPGSPDTFVWDVAKDTGGMPTRIQQVAHGIVQVVEETQPFFTEAARAILQAIMLALSLQAPGRWRFSDVFFVACSQKRTETILGLHHTTSQVIESYAANPRVMNDVFATMSAKLADFMPTAALWSHVQHRHPERTFSIKDFVRRNSVLLIEMQASASVSQKKLFALLLGRLSQELLDQETGQSTLAPERSRRTIIVIDEAPRVGKLDLIDLVTNGRDYGIGVLVAAQSIDAMLEHYPQDKLNALMNEFHTMGFLSANSPTTLKWMAERLGNSDSRLPQPGKSDAHDVAGEWASTLDPTQFLTLRQGKTIGPECIPGIFVNSQLGAWYSEEGVELPDVPRSPASRPIPDDWHQLRRWDDSDLARLNLQHLKSQLVIDSANVTKRPVGAPPPIRPRSPRSSPTQVPRFRP